MLPYNSSGGITNGGDYLPRVKLTLLSIFDTGKGTYPSIMGIHTGYIRPNKTIIVHQLYTYSCAGTCGHSEYVRFYDNSGGKYNLRLRNQDRLISADYT